MKFGVVVEKDEVGHYIASVPELPGCHTQAKTLDEVIKRIKKAIQAYLEAEGTRPRERIELVGFQFVARANILQHIIKGQGSALRC